MILPRRRITVPSGQIHKNISNYVMITVLFENDCFGTWFIYQYLVCLLWVCTCEKDLLLVGSSNFCASELGGEVHSVNKLPKVNTTWQASRKSATQLSLSTPFLFFQKITDILCIFKKLPLGTITKTLHRQKPRQGERRGMYVTAILWILIPDWC